MTLFVPVNVAEITMALTEMLREALPTTHSIVGATVERSEPVNESPDKCPWVGVYRARLAFPARTLGVGAGFRQQRVTLAIVMNESSSNSGEECEDKLELLTQAVVAVILSDSTLRGTVFQVDDADIVYANYTGEGNSFFQEAVLTITAVTNVTAAS